MVREWTVVAVAVAALVAGCGMDDRPSPPAEPQPQPGPGEFKADYATSSVFFTRMSAPVRGDTTHGTVRIWYSFNVRDLIAQDSFTVPVGTVSIKETDHDHDGSVDALVVMVKKDAGYDPDNGDWHYELRTPQGVLLQMPPPGKIAACIGCHKDYAQTDYLGGTKM